MKVFVAQLNPTVGDIQGNLKKILRSIEEARLERVDIFVSPELSICGYPPDDFLLYSDFVDEVEGALDVIARECRGIFAVVGTVRRSGKNFGKGLYNSAAIIIDGKVVGYKDKTVLPDFDVFNEVRYFEEGSGKNFWEYKNKRIGILICAEAWQQLVEERRYKRRPIEELLSNSPDLVISINASPYYYGKKMIRYEAYREASRKLGSDMIFCNQVGATDELVFDGYSVYFDKDGEIRQIASGFLEDHMICDTETKGDMTFKDDLIGDLYQALVLGVSDYFKKQGFTKACIGISGGVDSALTTTIAVDALGPSNVLGLRMPSRFSSLTSIDAAEALSKSLRIELMDIEIDTLFQNFLNLFSPIFYGRSFDSTEENLQARIRGMVLMAISNKLGHIILSTGNKSEMATGYTTLYGDMCGGLGVLSDVSKTQVYQLANWLNRDKEIIPQAIIDREPSAELKKGQRDIDFLPAYSIVDVVIGEYIENHRSIDDIVKKHGFKREVVKDLVERILRAEYKRRQGPPGIRVTKKSFGKGWVFPIVQGWT